jgi:TAT-translocated FGD2 family F420-dependent dehydrogenase
MKDLARQRLVSFMLPHEQFPVTELIELGQAAANVGFGVLSTSDHFQPWQANEGHCGAAWVTLGALTGRVQTWMGTTVTCPILRYQPAVVAQAFSTLGQLHPGRIFLGVGSGEAINEAAVTGDWPGWQERWDRMAEAIGIIRALWSGQTVSHHGQFYSVAGRLYDPPPQPIPLLVAGNGQKSIQLAGKYGDGLITDPRTWKNYKGEWQEAAREAGKNPDEMPVLVEHWIVAGDQNEAKQQAELWRFLPKVFKKYYNNPDPVAIMQQADKEVTLDQVTAEWIIGIDPTAHIEMICDLWDSGVAIVNVHSPQADLSKVIDFYGRLVLPNLKA